MATAKKDLTGNRVQGRPLIDLDEAWERLGSTRRDVSRFLTENSVSYLKVGDELAIDAVEFEAALRLRSVAFESDIASAARDLVRRARSAQGIPPKITEPSIISRIVALLQPDIDD
jgi:hypothetical protein